MKRSEFLRQLGLLSGGVAFGVQGMPVRAFAQNPLQLDLEGTDGNIMVLVQLAGGNDGLNTVIPYHNDTYYAKRPNLAIPKTSVLPVTDQQGFHPALKTLRELYDNGKVSVVQNVGYQNPNRSHFRSTDIWQSGSSATEYWTEGWVGRYLAKAFPEFPMALPRHPMAVQIGAVESMLTLSGMGSMGVVFDNPESFYQLVKGTPAETDPIENTIAGEELRFLQQIALQSIQYSDLIKQKADTGQNAITYPNTNLGRQLAIVAELIAGGMETPVYLTTLGGFDTHANQVVNGNITNGTHATLLKTIADAVAAFQKDLDKQGLADKVTVMTFSEFGRRVNQNGTLGTDHGTAAPLFVVGNTVRGGFVGSVPNLTNLDSNGDLKFTNDFRQVYASVLRDHMGVDVATTRSILGQEFETLPIYRRSSATLPSADGVVLEQNTPNPFHDTTEIVYSLSKAQYARLALYDIQGRELLVLREGSHDKGTYVVRVDGYLLVPGYYLYGIQTDAGRKVLRLIRT
ncbi:DUF1501 domain-containing protein [Nibrella saemangeumensis]|uniref:DUF1501 domain-containing protein n=1 Tax=Nibrella saemangeumensis TaxID=1084526 RepID=A0ABP8NF42_9BACT